MGLGGGSFLGMWNVGYWIQGCWAVGVWGPWSVGIWKSRVYGMWGIRSEWVQRGLNRCREGLGSMW